MRARTVMWLRLIVLAGTLALPLVVSVVALRGPGSVSHAADGDPAVIATGAVGGDPYRVAVNPCTYLIYAANGGDGTVSVIGDMPTPTDTPTPVLSP
jgi:DNA-binding beta-propeller fold protein YncE